MGVGAAGAGAVTHGDATAAAATGGGATALAVVVGAAAAAATTGIAATALAGLAVVDNAQQHCSGAGGDENALRHLHALPSYSTLLLLQLLPDCNLLVYSYHVDEEEPAPPVAEGEHDYYSPPLTFHLKLMVPALFRYIYL